MCTARRRRVALRRGGRTRSSSPSQGTTVRPRPRGPAQPGVADHTPEPILDPTLDAADVHLDGASATPLVVGDGEAPLERARRRRRRSRLCRGGRRSGGGPLGSRATYAAERRQFGRTIGSFQAVRHLLADMLVKVESSWSSVLYAAASLDEGEPDDLRTASIAKA